MTSIQVAIGALAAAAVSVGLIVAGVALLAGGAWSMICAGVLGLSGVGAVLLYDPDGNSG